MAKLKAFLQFQNVAAGASASLPHGLTIDTRRVIPDLLLRSDFSFSATADATNVTVTNRGTATASVDVVATYDHTILRAYGVAGQAAEGAVPFVPGGVIDVASGSVTGLTLVTTPSYAVDAYIDAVNGNDANSGLSTAAPLRTIAGFYQAFPFLYGNGARITANLAGGGGFGASATSQINYTGVQMIWVGGLDPHPAVCFRGPYMVPITPATGTSAPTLTATPTQIVDQTNAVNAAGQRTKFNFVAAGWTVNDLRDKLAWIRVRRGGNMVLFELPITDNDASACYVDAAPIAVGTVLQTDTVEIVTVGAMIVRDTVAENFDYMRISGFGSYQSFAGFGVTTTGHTFERIGFSGNVIVQNVPGVGFDRCGFDGPLLEIHGGSNTAMFGCKSRGEVDWNTHGGNFYSGRPDSATSPDPGNLYTQSHLVIVNGGRLYIGGVEGGSGGTWRTQYNLCVTGSTAVDAIHVEGSTAFLNAGTIAAATITGRNNNSYGLNPRYGGQILVQGGQKSTITAGTNDMRVAKTAGINWGTGVGQFQEVAGFNGNFHRVGGSTATVPLGDLSRIGIP